MMQDVHVKLNPGFPQKKTAFNKKKTLFASQLDLRTSKKLVKNYIWSIALHGAEI